MSRKSISIRMDSDMLEKLHYIAAYEDRSANSEVINLIRKRIMQFEKENGEIQFPVKWK